MGVISEENREKNEALASECLWLGSVKLKLQLFSILY